MKYGPLGNARRRDHLKMKCFPPLFGQLGNSNKIINSIIGHWPKQEKKKRKKKRGKAGDPEEEEEEEETTTTTEMIKKRKFVSRSGRRNRRVAPGGNK